jgi:hypothetical protein
MNASPHPRFNKIRRWLQNACSTASHVDLESISSPNINPCHPPPEAQEMLIPSTAVLHSLATIPDPTSLHFQEDPANRSSLNIRGFVKSHTIDLMQITMKRGVLASVVAAGSLRVGLRVAVIAVSWRLFGVWG